MVLVMVEPRSLKGSCWHRAPGIALLPSQCAGSETSLLRRPFRTALVTRARRSATLLRPAAGFRLPLIRWSVTPDRKRRRQRSCGACCSSWKGKLSKRNEIVTPALAYGDARTRPPLVRFIHSYFLPTSIRSPTFERTRRRVWGLECLFP